MRRRRAESDSLDMLLDTICNVLGGIVFIVMLIAVLAFARAGDDSLLRGKSRAEVQAAFGEASRIVRLELRRDELLEALAALSPEVEVAADDSTDIESRRLELMELLAEAESRRARLEELRQRVRGDVRELAEQVDDAEGMAAELERQIESLTRRVEQERARRTVEARLPIRRTTRREPIHCVIRGDRIHVLWTLDPNTRTPAWGRTEPRDVRSVRTPVAGGDQVDIHLLPNGGFRINEDFATHPRWRELIATAAREQTFLSFFVEASGFESFLQVKAATLGAGFQYDVMTWDGVEPVSFVPGTDFTSQ